MQPGNQANIFSYTDPVDQSVADNQGMRFILADGSRIIVRKSGTGSSGITLRMYFEQYVPNTGDLTQDT